MFITGFKLIIGLLTGSLGILSEALHSALDMVAAVITYFSVRMSDKPADREHNYGHGKIENLSALIETLLLLITCIWIIYEAIHRLTSGQTVIEVTVWSYVVVISSIVIDFTRSRALLRVAKKHNSAALEADALHFSTDIWSSTVVLFGLIAYQLLGWYAAD
jgi:cation diffusion facilitator family transporter